MTCSVLPFPRAKKRGRKVTKGPRASVTVLRKNPVAAPARTVETEVDRIAATIAARALRERAERAGDDRLIVFPKERRFRSLAEIRDLEELAERERLRALGQWTPLMEEMSRIAAEIGRKARAHTGPQP